MSRELDAALAALERGGIVCFPTESSYGLAARIDHADALARLAVLKQREPDAPFGLVAGTIEQARALAAAWPERAEALARAHWPGPLTLVVPARSGLPPEIIGPGGGVGVRIPSADVARELPTRAGVALTATSANPRGEAPALSITQARGYFGESVDVYLDGGLAEDVLPSTVVSVAIDGHLRVLRAGAIVIQVSPP